MAINYDNANEYNVLQLVKDAESKQLYIPEFQRHFIWDKIQIKLLIDSIYRKYTFSSILIWNGTEELARRRVGGSITEIITPSDNSQSTVSYILDGQQRTTSLLMVLSEVKVYKGKNTRKTENRTLYFDSEAPENDPELLFVFEDEIIEINGEEVLLRKLSEKEIFEKYKGRFINLKHVYQYKTPDKANPLQTKIQGYLNNDLNETLKYITTLNNLADKILSRKVSLIFQTGTLENVLEVFERINTKNTKLSIYDVMVAKTYYRLQEDGTDFIFNLNQYVKMISCRAGITDKYLKNETDIELDKVKLIPDEDEATLLFLVMLIVKKVFVQKEILKITAQELYTNMKTINRIIVNAVEELERFHTQDRLWDFIPALKLTVSLYTKHQNLNTIQAKSLISFWFWNTLIYNRYPGGQNERIQRDYENIDFTNETKTKNFIMKDRTRDFSKDELLECSYDRKNEQIYLAISTLFQNNAPKDFYSGIDLNLTSKPLEHHHIFPFSSDFAKDYRQQNTDPEKVNIINNIANITLLTDETNNKIRKQNPSVYITELEKEYIQIDKKDEFNAIMRSQFIDNDMIEMLKEDQFDNFIKKRTALIKAKINALCEVKP